MRRASAGAMTGEGGISAQVLLFEPRMTISSSPTRAAVPSSPPTAAHNPAQPAPTRGCQRRHTAGADTVAAARLDALGGFAFNLDVRAAKAISTPVRMKPRRSGSSLAALLDLPEQHSFERTTRVLASSASLPHLLRTEARPAPRRTASTPSPLGASLTPPAAPESVDSEPALGPAQRWAQRLALLRGCPLLSALPPAELERVAAVAAERKCVRYQRVRAAGVVMLVVAGLLEREVEEASPEMLANERALAKIVPPPGTPPQTRQSARAPAAPASAAAGISASTSGFAPPSLALQPLSAASGIPARFLMLAAAALDALGAPASAGSLIGVDKLFELGFPAPPPLVCAGPVTLLCLPAAALLDAMPPWLVSTLRCESRARLLRKLPPFASVSLHQLRGLASSLSLRRCARETPIFCEGDPAAKVQPERAAHARAKSAHSRPRQICAYLFLAGSCRRPHGPRPLLAMRCAAAVASAIGPADSRGERTAAPPHPPLCPPAGAHPRRWDSRRV